MQAKSSHVFTLEQMQSLMGKSLLVGCYSLNNHRGTIAKTKPNVQFVVIGAEVPKLEPGSIEPQALARLELIFFDRPCVMECILLCIPRHYFMHS